MDGGGLQFLEVGQGAEGRPIAFRLTPGAAPAAIWLGGFRSDMEGTKALALAEWGERTGRAVVRLDYSGHGASGGRFEDGTVGRWSEEALAVICAHGGRSPVLLGSSMGGWIALLCARAMEADGNAPSGLVLIAPAVDFTERLMWDVFPDEVKRRIEAEGVWHRPSAYSDTPYPITRGLIEDGRRHLLLGTPFRVGAPIRVLQGMQDPDVPWRHAMTVVEHLAEDDVVLTLVKDGDHRLSRPEDIARMIAAVEAIADHA